MQSTKFWFLSLLVCSALPGPSIIVHAAGLEVHYDQKRDRLSVQADQEPLSRVLAVIAAKARVNILMDPSINKTVSLRLAPQSLQKALQKVCKGLSYVIEYHTDVQQRSVVSGLRLLPQGKQDTGQLVPVAVLNARAGRHDAVLSDISAVGGGNIVDGSGSSLHGQERITEKRSAKEAVAPVEVTTATGPAGNDDGAGDKIQPSRPAPKRVRPEVPSADY